jgi:predicted PurR-regulated permease PerM
MPVTNKKITIEVSSLTIFKIVIVGLLLAVAYYLRDILMLVFISLILASAIDPWVDFMQKKRIPRILGITFIYIIALAALFSSSYLLIGPISNEIKSLSADFPGYWEKASAGWQQLELFSKNHGLDTNIQNVLTTAQEALTLMATNFFGGIFSFFGDIFSILVVLVMTFYLALYDTSMKKSLRLVLPAKYQPYFMHLINRMQEKIGLWLRGQLLLSLIIFILSLIGLLLLGVKYAWVLALFAGITEIIPYLGPFIGAIPAVFIAFTFSPALGLAVLVLYFIIQESENYIIVPQVMKRAVGLNPVIVITAMMIGMQIAGLIGIIIAIPVTTALGVLIDDLLSHKKTGFNPKKMPEEA